MTGLATPQRERITSAPDPDARQYVSTGRLPVPDQVRTLLYAAHERFRTIDEGENANVYPALAAVGTRLVSVCRYSGPPARLRSPVLLSSSVTAITSVGSPRE